MNARPLPTPRALGHWATLLLPVLAAVLVLRGASPWLLLAVCLALALIAFPEVCLALFLTAGAFKDELSAFLPSGIDATLLLAGLLILGLIVRTLRTGLRATLPPLRLALPLGLLTLVMLTSLLTAEPNLYGREKTLRFVVLTLPAALAAAALLGREPLLRRFLLTFLGLGLVMTVFGTVTSEGLRAFGATHIATGRVIGLGLLAVVYLLSRGRFRLPVLLPALPAGGAMVFGLLYSGSRGALAAFLVSLLATGLLLLSQRRARRWAVVGLAALCLMVGAVTFLAPDAVRLMNERMRGVNLSTPYAGATGARVNLAQAAVEAFGSSPLVGLGPGGYNLSLGYGDAPRGMYPHNIVLEFAAEYGLLGLAAFLFLCGLALRNAVSALRRGTDRAGLVTGALGFAVLVYCLANAIVSGDINDNRLLFTAIGLCAALAGPGAQPQVRDPQSPATP